MRTLPYDLREAIKRRKSFVVLFELDHPVDGNNSALLENK